MTPDLGPFFHKFLTPGPEEKRRILLESTPVIRIRSHLWQMSCPLAPSASKPLFSERHTFTDNFLWGPLWGVAKNNDKKYNRASILLLARENLNLLNRGNQEKICEFSTNVVVECGKIVTFLNVLRPGPQPEGGASGQLFHSEIKLLSTTSNNHFVPLENIATTSYNQCAKPSNISAVCGPVRSHLKQLHSFYSIRCRTTKTLAAYTVCMDTNGL